MITSCWRYFEFENFVGSDTINNYDKLERAGDLRLSNFVIVRNDILAQEKTECELQRVLLMAGHLPPALRREDLR